MLVCPSAERLGRWYIPVPDPPSPCQENDLPPQMWEGAGLFVALTCLLIYLGHSNREDVFYERHRLGAFVHQARYFYFSFVLCLILTN